MKLSIQFIIILLRGIYGVLCGIIISILVNTGLFLSVLYNIFNDLAPYFTWIYLPLLYIPSIIIIKLLVKVDTKFDLLFRGSSVYFAISILTYVVLNCCG